MVNIKIIAGSSRPGNFNQQPAQWLYELAKEHTDINVELIDVTKLNLPFLDEPVPPMMHQYSKDYTKAWAEKVGEADGFIVVAGEYNHSMTAVLKNAFDYLNLEWNYKPISYVSYGSGAGGARSVEHLRGVAGELRMFDLREQLLLNEYYRNLDDKGNYKFTDEQKKMATTIIKDTAFWASELKASRAKLQANK